MHQQYSKLKRLKKDEKVDVKMKIHKEPSSCTTNCKGFNQYPQNPELE